MLRDPQLQNSYAYARNNPLRYSDPDGEFPVPVLVALGFSEAGAQVVSGAFFAAGGASALINLYEYQLTRQYPDTYTDTERSIATGKALFSTLTFGAGLFARIGEATILQAGDLILNSASNYNFNNSPAPSQTYTTPNGTVVDWSGNIISKPSQSSEKRDGN